MKRTVAMLLAVMLLLACLPVSVLAAEGDGIEAVLNCEGMMIPVTFRESDFSRSAYEYNQDLAVLTLCMELTAYSAETKASWGEDGPDDSDIAARRSANIADAYAKLGFDSAAYYNYGVSLNESSDKAAFSIGQKALSDGSTLVTAFLRGGGYGSEWVSNFNLTEDAMAQGYHQGFNAAADKVLAQLTETLAQIPGPVKVWITSYSRGAAVANLLAGKLDDYALTTDRLAPEDIFAYTFATPCTVLPVRDPTAERYGNLFNIVNPGDIVTMVPPTAWGYGRYGVTKAFDVDAAEAVLQGVNQAWDKYWETLPEGAFDVATIKQVFSSGDAGKNLRMREGFQLIMDTLTAAYPTEDSARTLMGFIREMLLFGNLKENIDGAWQPAGPEKWLELLNEKYGEESVMATYQAVQALITEEPFSTLDSVLGTLGFGKYFPLFLTVGTLDGLEMHATLVLILKILLANAPEYQMTLSIMDTYLADIHWSDWIAGNGPGAVVGNTFGTVFQDGEELKGYAQNLREQVIFGHLPVTYLAWLAQPEQDTFGFAAEAPGPKADEPEAPETEEIEVIGASNWAVEEIREALAAGLVPAELQADYRSPVSRLAVSGMFVRLLEAASGKGIAALLEERGLSLNYEAFTDTDDANVLAMNALGIINGMGEGQFGPGETLTRAQIAAILNRVAKVLGVETEGYTHSFTDVAGTWVDQELGWPASVGIVNGVGEGRFDPKGVLTAEQAIAISLRCLKALKGA